MSATRRFARLLRDGAPVFVEVEDGGAHVLDGLPWLDATSRTGEHLDGDVLAEAIAHRTLLAPVAPSKILCVGRNYLAHSRELNNEPPKEPLLFFKPPSALVGSGGRVELPPRRIAERIDHEAELAVVVGKRLRNASLASCIDAVFALTIAADVTARDLQKKDGQWARAKGMDTFCPVGPVITAGADIAEDRTIRAWVGDTLRQEGWTRDMMFSVPFVLEYASQVFTLEPGDLVLTGTPEGVGPLVDGDRLRIAIDGLGELSVGVEGHPEDRLAGA